MLKKRYKDGGDVDYAKDVVNFVKRNQANKKVTDMSIKDIPAVARETGATAAGMAALPFADVASGVVNAYRRRNEAKSAKQTPTTAEQQMIQEEKDRQMAPKLEKAYNESLTNTAPPQKKAKGGVTRADGCISKGHTKGKMV
jgi:negative regulator of sigma E activity